MNYKEKLNIKTFIFDVDGVLTDGKILLPSGEQMRSMSVKDGMAIKAIKKGYLVAIISGGKSQGLIERFNILKLTIYTLLVKIKKMLLVI